MGFKKGFEKTAIIGTVAKGIGKGIGRVATSGLKGMGKVMGGGAMGLASVGFEGANAFDNYKKQRNIMRGASGL